jgi:hypothetical protein
MKAKHGRVTYGTRAFHQDATEAMGGDIVRALIETITNSDDAYGNKYGRIRVEIEHRRGPWKVVTKDRATGMSAARMEMAIASLGERTSGFEAGADVRGNLGRGAKDIAAFGNVEFESICQDEYAHMELDAYGNYTIDPPTRVTSQSRERLGIPHGNNGTVVTIHVNEITRCPQHAKLVTKLSRHYQLRDIMSDPNREVTLVDLNSGQSDILRYQTPVFPIVFQAELPIEGYPEAKAKLTLYRNMERYDDLPSDPTRPGGVLIKGRRAIYENTLFRFESNPYAGWFSGRVECPYIDQIATDYDTRLLTGQPPDDANPMPIISRKRDGLQKVHPFYRKLAAAVEKPLSELVLEEEKRAREQTSAQSSRLKRRLDGLSRDISRLINEDLRAIEEEGLTGAQTASPNSSPVRLVPPEDVVLYMGEDKTVSVMVDPELNTHQVFVRCEPAGVVEVLDGVSIPLLPHRRRPDLLTGQIHLRPLLEDQTILTVTCADKTTEAILEVRSERATIEVEVHPVERLQFEHDNYRIAWTRRKAIQIMAPLVDIATNGTAVSVSSSDPGVVVRKSRLAFSLDEELEQYVAEVPVEARTLSSHATLTAKLGDLCTSCNVTVTKEEGPTIEVLIRDQEAGNYRAIVETNGSQTIIYVMGQHPVMKRYRGPAPNFPGDDLPMTRAIIAEIVADSAVRMILEKKFPSSLNEQVDAARFYAEHYTYMSKYLPRCHRALLSDTQLAQLEASSNQESETTSPA